MKRLIRLLAISILLAVIAGCQPTSVEPKEDPGKEIPQPSGGKEDPEKEDPEKEDPHEGYTGPTDEDYAGWNMTGKFLIPDADARVNPNFFLTEEGDPEVVSWDDQTAIAVLRFKKDVPKLYKGALLIVDLSEEYRGMLIYVESAKMNGNEATVTFRPATINELFFNRKLVFSTGPTTAPGLDSDVIVLTADDEDDDVETKADDDDSAFISLQKKYELLKPSIAKAEMETNVSNHIFPYFDIEKVDIDENGKILEGKMLAASMIFSGKVTVSADLSVDFELNSDFDMFEEKLKIKEFKPRLLRGQAGVVPIRIWFFGELDCKMNGGVSGKLNVGAHARYISDGYSRISYYGGLWDNKEEFARVHWFGWDPPKIKECEASIKVGPVFKLTALAYGFAGIRIEPFFFIEGSYKGKPVDSKTMDANIGMSGGHSLGFDTDASVVVKKVGIFIPDTNDGNVQIDKDDCHVIIKWPAHDPLFKWTFHRFPAEIEPKEEEKLDMIMDYGDELGDEIGDEMRMCVWDKNETLIDPKTPSENALVKLETLSNMPEDMSIPYNAKGSKRAKTKADDGLQTSHGVEYLIADEKGEVVVEYKVPGPMQYDYTFKTSVIDGDGNETITKNLYPLNRFKSYKATYKASECSGSTTLTIEDYGHTITEKGELHRTMVIDGEVIYATYIVDSDFDELFEIADVNIGSDAMYVTANLKYYAGECILDPVLEHLDYIRWDQAENGNYQGYTFSECKQSGIDECVHVTGPECSVFFSETDITYWQNMPVKVATGYLDEDCTQYSYLTLTSYEIIDDSSEDREKNEGNTGYEPLPSYEGDGGDLWDGGFDLGGAGDDDRDKGYYVRIDKEPESWEGKYLIVNEKDQVFYPGDLSNIYGSWNGEGTHADNGRILVTDPNKASYFTISRLPDGKYTILSTRGYYLGCKDSTSPAFNKWSDEPIPNSIKYDTANNCVLIQGYYDHTFCYNLKDHMFTFSTWTAYGAGGDLYPIQLYKLHE